MKGQPEPCRVEYRVSLPSETESIVKLLAEVFSRHDPLALAVGVTAEDFESFVRLLIPRVESEGLTVVARCAQTGMVIGALLAEDSASPAPEGMKALGAKFEPVMDILGQLSAMHSGDQDPRPGEVLHLYLLGVSDDSARRGIGQGLVKACIENGARRGYRLAVAEATNKVSQHIFYKLGFAGRAHMSYKDFLFEGCPVFSSIQDHGGAVLVEKTLTE